MCFRKMQKKMLSPFLTAYFLLFETAVVQSRSTGAPTSACSSITPGHGGSSGTLPGGFYLYSNLIDCGGNYIANQAYTSTALWDTDLLCNVSFFQSGCKVLVVNSLEDFLYKLGNPVLQLLLDHSLLYQVEQRHCLAQELQQLV